MKRFSFYKPEPSAFLRQITRSSGISMQCVFKLGHKLVYQLLLAVVLIAMLVLVLNSSFGVKAQEAENNSTQNSEQQATEEQRQVDVKENLEAMTTQMSDEIAFDEELFQQGLTAYKANYCGLCHESKFANTKGIFGPPHYSNAIIAEARIQDANYKTSLGSATTAEDYLRESILNPEDYIVPGYALARHRMPAYTHLSKEDVDALVYLLLNTQ